jgi:hypothetical protein
VTSTTAVGRAPRPPHGLLGRLRSVPLRSRLLGVALGLTLVALVLTTSAVSALLRGYLFTQEVPDDPNALPYTWHADGKGRVLLQRTHPKQGPDAWLVSPETVIGLVARVAVLVPPPSVLPHSAV